MQERLAHLTELAQGAIANAPHLAGNQDDEFEDDAQDGDEEEEPEWDDE